MNRFDTTSYSKTPPEMWVESRDRIRFGRKVSNLWWQRSSLSSKFKYQILKMFPRNPCQFWPAPPHLRIRHRQNLWLNAYMNFVEIEFIILFNLLWLKLYNLNVQTECMQPFFDLFSKVNKSANVTFRDILLQCIQIIDVIQT